MLKIKLENPFIIDLRALAFLRIAVSLIILLDLTLRFPDIAVFLSDDGAWPSHASIDYADSLRFSLYWLNGSQTWAVFLFFLAAVSAFFMLVGARVKIATFSSFILLFSLHNRNPLLLQGGDNLLLLLVFWGNFLPWGDRYSVQSALSRYSIKAVTVFSPGTVAVLIQVMSVYFFSALLKSGPEWTENGTGIYYALSNIEYGVRLAPIWRDWHFLTVPLSHYVWWLEMLGPLIAFLPIFTRYTKPLVFLLFASLETGFIFNMAIGLFPLISISSLLVFLPSGFFDKLEKKISERKKEKLIIFYDKECQFCEKISLIIRSFLLLKKSVLIIPAQDHEKFNRVFQEHNSWVVYSETGKVYLKFYGLLKLFQVSTGLKFLDKSPARINRLGNKIYNTVSANRSCLSRLSAICLPWESSPTTFNKPTRFIAIFTATSLFYWNLTTIPDWSNIHGFKTGIPEGAKLDYPSFLFDAKTALRLDQKWNMFAPYPDKGADSLFMPGLTLGGDLVDVQHLDDRPVVASAENREFPGFLNRYRWRKFLTRMASRRGDAARDNFGHWICGEVNDRRKLIDKIAVFNIYAYRQMTPEPGQPKRPESRRRVARYHCFDKSQIRFNQVEKKLFSENIF